MRIFITRDYDPGVPPGTLQKWCAESDNELIAKSLLRFDFVPFVPRFRADWWFFYSPRAVEFAAFLLPNGTRIAAMGLGTTAALAPRKVDFTGEGSPAAVAEQFAALAAGQRVFFPRARQSRRSVEKMLGKRILAENAVCYDNQAVPPRDPISADVYVFTSPLNVAAYLDHHKLPDGARTVALGPSTAGALVQRGREGVVLERPTEQALVSCLNGWRRL